MNDGCGGRLGFAVERRGRGGMNHERFSELLWIKSSSSDYKPYCCCGYWFARKIDHFGTSTTQSARYPASYIYALLIFAHIIIIRTAHQPSLSFLSNSHTNTSSQKLAVPYLQEIAVCQCCATVFRDLPDISQSCLKRRLRMRSGPR